MRLSLLPGTIIIKTSGKRQYRYYVTRIQTVGTRDYYWAKRIIRNMIKGNERIVCDNVQIQKQGRYKVEASA